MANSALIDELLKQFAENPRRVFARLAAEYRKAGELDAAIQICRSFVPQQPTYISGYIVLGQALFESGQLDEARSTFETALGLDPENVIALRQLGDIAHASGDLEGARRWYHRLLEVDPQNEEIAEQLRALEPPPAAPAPAAPSEAEAPVSWSDINPERAPAAPTPAPAEMPADPGTIDLPDVALTPPPIPSALDLNLTPPAPVMEDVSADVTESSANDPSALFDAIPEIPSEAVGMPTVDLYESMRVLDGGAERGDDPFAASPSSAEPTGAAPPMIPAGTSTPPAPAFVTETMAELYLKQGLRDQALAIFRQLAAERPDDKSLRTRIAELEYPSASASRDDGHPRTARAFFGTFAYRRPPSARGSTEPEPARHTAPADSPAESTNGEAGLSDLFPDRSVSRRDADAAATLAGAFSDPYPPATPAPTGPTPPNGAPARAANDELSLDDVFGSQQSESDAHPPASHVSFDEFFARRDANGTTDVVRPSSPPAGTERQAHGESDGASGSPPAGGQDLELFHAWLEGLKK